MRARRANSAFTGVLTLKTPEQVAQLAGAVKTLVETAVSVFAYLDNNKTAELNGIIANMETVAHLAGEFLDLIVEDEELSQAKAIVKDLQASVATCKSLFDGYVDDVEERRKDDIKDTIGDAMQLFLGRTADLTDVMEDNQNKQGIAKIRQAFQAMQMLARDNEESMGTSWEAKIQFTINSLGCLNLTLAERLK